MGRLENTKVSYFVIFSLLHVNSRSSVGLGLGLGGVCLHPGGVCSLGGVCSRGVSALGVSAPGGCLLPGGVCCRGVSALGGGVSQHGQRQTPPPVNRITHACENITLPQLRCGRLMMKHTTDIKSKNLIYTLQLQTSQ